MQELNELQLLGLTITLSAIVQVVRRRFLDKNVDFKIVRNLLFADVPLVLGGIILLLLLNLDLLNCEYPEWALIIPIICLELAIIVLIYFVIREWKWNK